MTRKKLIGYAVVLAAILGPAATMAYLHSTRGVCISLTNNTQSVLQQMEIAYTGGVIRIATLEPQASYACHVNLTGESILRLGWFDASDGRHFYMLDTYLDPDYAGSVKIVWEPNNRMSVTQKVRAGPIWRGPATRTYSLLGDVNGIR